MVTKKKLKAYEFTTIEQYYEYIYLSVLNGQRKQAINLIEDMNKVQMKDCLRHFINEYTKKNDKANYCIDLIIDAL